MKSTLGKVVIELQKKKFEVTRADTLFPISFRKRIRNSYAKKI